MKRSLAGWLIVAFTIPVLVGCGDGQDSSTLGPARTSNAPSEYSLLPADSTPTAPFGATQEIRSTGFAVGLSDYTVSNPRTERGRFMVDLAIATKEGQCIPGSFFVLTDQGNKTEALDMRGPGGFDSSGALIAGEKRTGTLSFEVPSGDTVTKFVLYHGTINPPVAYWVTG